MDDGGYKVAYESKPYTVFDEETYFEVYNWDKSPAHIASFKEKDEAVAYVLWKKMPYPEGVI